MGGTLRTKTLNWSCGLFATLLGLASLPFVGWNLYWAWHARMSGDSPWLVAYFVLVAALFAGVPVVFVRAYSRWQRRNGIGSALPGPPRT
jgi:hypothetical protein